MVTILAVPVARLAALCRRYHVRELALFGSALREDFSANSDIDLLVEFEPHAEIGFWDLSGLQIELEQLVGRRVDLVPKHGLKPPLREHVLAGSRMLYAAT
jgi:predicted nucleotidyltransferase